MAYVHDSYLPARRSENVCGILPASAGRRDRTTQGAVLKYGERLNGAGFNFVNGAETYGVRQRRCVNIGRRCNLLEDGRIHNRFLDPNGILSRWVLLDQCQGSVDAVEQVGSDEGGVPPCENIELDHNPRLCRTIAGDGEVSKG